jgi:hypothetical protein
MVRLLALSLLKLWMEAVGRETVGGGEVAMPFRCDVFCLGTTTGWFDRRSGFGCAATTAGARLQGGPSPGSRHRNLHSRSARSQDSTDCLDCACQTTH